MLVNGNTTRNSDDDARGGGSGGREIANSERNVVIVAGQVSRIISPARKFAWDSRFAWDTTRLDSARLAARVAERSASPRPGRESVPDHDFRHDQPVTCLVTCMHPPLTLSRAETQTRRFTSTVVRESVHRTDVPAARAARTAQGAAPAPREEPEVDSASAADAPVDGAASSAPFPAGSSGSTSAPRGAPRLGHRQASPVP